MGIGMRRGGRRGGARRARPARRQHQNRARRNRQHRRGNRRGGAVLFHRGGRPLGHFNFGGRGHRGHGFRGRFAVGMLFYRRRGGRGGGASVGNSTGAGVSGTEPQQCTPIAQLIVVIPVTVAMFIAGVILFTLNVSWVMGISFMGLGGGLLVLCLIACFLQCFDEVDDDKDAASEVDVEAQSRCQSELSVSTVTHQSQAVPMAMLQSTYNQGQGAWTTSTAPQAAPGHYPHPQTQMQATDPMASHYHAQHPVMPYHPQVQAQDPMSSHYQTQNPITAYPPQAQQHETLASYHPQAQPPLPMTSHYPQVPYQPHAQLNSNSDRTQPTETEIAPPPAYEDVIKAPST